MSGQETISQKLSAAEMTALKQRVARDSMIAAAVMTLLKLAAGLASGSLGVLSDAAHSGLDLVGAAMTFFSVRVSDKPADEDHTYGHGKIENLSALGEAVLMAISCVWIIAEALERIFNHHVELHHSIWPIVVLLLSIAVDFWRSRKLLRAAHETGSPALATDAFHFASDIWSTVAVLGGVTASWLGASIGVSRLGLADPVAAVMVSLMILRLTILLGRETIAILMDAIPAETRRTLITAVSGVEGVLAVEKARVRRAGAGYFVDLTLAMPRRYTFEHTNDLVVAATEAARRVLPDADVVVHTVPRETRAESLFDRVRAAAARHNVSVHDLSVQLLHGKLHVEQHLELNERLTLLKAHEFVCKLEAEILSATPEIDSILTHIESEPATIELPDEMVEEDRRIEKILQRVAQQFEEIVDVHEVRVGRSGEQLALSCHCTLPDEMTMQRVHGVISALEDRFKQECREVQRVTIHPEPVTDNLR
jgi:cation diffusion facilitator family transporter